MVDKYHFPLKTAPINDKTIQLLDDYIIFNTKIPSGYIFNGKSIPKILWPILQPLHGGLRACLVHSYNYEIKKEKRYKVDREFYQNSIKCGINSVMARIAYFTIRCFNWYNWRYK